MKKIIILLLFSFVVKGQVRVVYNNDWSLTGNTPLANNRVLGLPVLNTQTLSRIRIAPTLTEMLDIGADGAGSLYIWSHRKGSKTYTNYNWFSDEYDNIFNDSSSFQIRFNNTSRVNVSNNILNQSTDFFRISPASFTKTAVGEVKRFYIAARTIGFQSAGSLAIFRDNWIEQTTYTASAGVTLTDVAALKVDDGVISTNVTATNNWGLYNRGNLKILSVGSNKYLELEGTAGQLGRMSADGSGIYFGSATNVSARFIINNGTFNPIWMQTDGTVNIQNKMYIGSTSTTPTALLHLNAGTTSAAQIRFTSSVAPTTPNDGDLWFDGTNLKIRVSGVTYTLTKT